MKTLLSILTGVFVCFGEAAEAAKLKPETLRAWDTYVQIAEKRIDAELSSASGFLRADFLKPSAAASNEAAIKSGRIYIQKISALAAIAATCASPTA